MSSQLEFLNRRVEGVASRVDSLLDRQLRDREAAQARADAEMEEAKRKRARYFAEGCREVQVRYDSAFSAFGTQTPQAVDDEHPERYRSRLLGRLVRKLPPDSKWSGTRADDLPLGPALDTVEALIIEAAKQEGLAPSEDNLPEDGTMVMRVRGDDSNGKQIEWHGRESFIAQMNRPGRKVMRICNPRTGQTIWSRQAG